MQFNLNIGEVDVNFSAAAGSASYSASDITQMYFKNGRLNIRPSTKLLATITLPEGVTYDNEFLDESRKWLFFTTKQGTDYYLHVITDLSFDALTANPAMYDFKTQNSIKIGPAQAVRVTFESVKKDDLTETMNPVVGDRAILILGSDMVYYADDEVTTATALKEFKIMANGKPKPFLKPKFAKKEQQRLFIGGAGADLAADEDAKLANTNAIYGSATLDKLDNFTITTSTTVRDTQVAFKFEFFLEPTEELYGMSSFLNQIIITSSHQIYVLSSPTGQISAVSGSLNAIAGDEIGCKPAEPVRLNSYLLYCANQGLRNNFVAAVVQGQQMYQLYDSATSTYRDLVFDKLKNDPVNNCVMGFPSDGSGYIKSLYWAPIQGQQQTPSLGMTTYYRSGRFSGLSAARTASKINDLLILRDRANPATIHIVQETKEYTGMDLMQAWDPKVVVSEVSGNTITVDSLLNMTSADSIIGLWIEFETDVWLYLVRDYDTELKFTYINDKPGYAPTVPGTYRCIPDTTSIYEQIPTWMTDNLLQENARIDVTINEYTATKKKGGFVNLSTNVIYKYTSKYTLREFTNLSLTKYALNKESWAGTFNMTIGYEFAHPAISWLTENSFFGAPKQTAQYVVTYNSILAYNWDIITFGAAGKKENNTKHLGYCTLLVYPDNHIGVNEYTTIRFRFDNLDSEDLKTTPCIYNIRS